MARAIVDTVAPHFPEYIDFLHNSGVTTQFEARLSSDRCKGGLRILWTSAVFYTIIKTCTRLTFFQRHTLHLRRLAKLYYSILKRFLSNRKGWDQVFLKLQISLQPKKLQPSFMKRGRKENNVVAWNSSMTCNLGLPSWYIRHPWWENIQMLFLWLVVESPGGTPWEPLGFENDASARLSLSLVRINL